MTSYQKLGCYSSVIFAKCRLIFYVNGKSPDPKKNPEGPKTTSHKPLHQKPNSRSQPENPNPVTAINDKKIRI